jgi:hypothetical protein
MNHLYCSVKFEGTEREYAYRTFFTDLEQGDLVVVVANGTLTLAYFQQYIDPPNFPCKLVVAFVDQRERKKGVLAELMSDTVVLPIHDSWDIAIPPEKE